MASAFPLESPILAAPVTSQSGSFGGSVTVSAFRKSPVEEGSDAKSGRETTIERIGGRNVDFINAKGLRVVRGRTLNKEIFRINRIL